MKRREVSVKAFKRLSVASTLAGLLVMAAGLNELVTHARFPSFLALFAAGGVLASVTVLFVRPREEPRFVVELFVRAGCSLCEEPALWLAEKSREYGFTVWERDVDEDAGLATKYGDFVPVAVLDGREELFRLSADYEALERRFRRLADAQFRRA